MTAAISHAFQSAHGTELARIAFPKVATTLTEKNSRDFVRQNVNPYEQPDVYAKAVAEAITPKLSAETREVLHNLGRTGKPHAVLITGLPLDRRIPKGKTIEQRLNKKTRVSESGLLALAELMRCRMQRIPREHGGKPIHNLSPVAGKEASESSISLNAFRHHTDDPCEQKPCDFVMLYGLEADSGSKTSFFPIRSVLRNVSPESHYEMQQPNFTFRSGGSATYVERGTFPMIGHDPVSNVVRVRMYESQEMGRITPLTAGAQRALNELDDHFATILKRPEEHIQTVDIQPGEALVLNNGWGVGKVGGVMHGRMGTIENPHRWLQRGLAERLPE